MEGNKKNKKTSNLHDNDGYDPNHNKEEKSHNTPISCNLIKEFK